MGRQGMRGDLDGQALACGGRLVGSRVASPALATHHRWSSLCAGGLGCSGCVLVALEAIENFRAKLRGNSPPMLDYTWNKIYNSKSMMSCSNMPRFGYQGILIEQQMRDVMTYLSDANSPAHR